MAKRNPNSRSGFGNDRVPGLATRKHGVKLALPLMPVLTYGMMPDMRRDTMIAEPCRQREPVQTGLPTLSSEADDGGGRHLLQVGVQAFPIKPFRVDELLTRVAALIGNWLQMGYRLWESKQVCEAAFEMAMIRLKGYLNDLKGQLRRIPPYGEFFADQAYLPPEDWS